MKKRKKWLWIPITALVLTAAVAGVLIFKPGQSKEPVYVYRVGDGMIGMTDYYEGGSESYGTVTTDRVQPVYLTNTQTVLSVPVAEGQQVKKGDTLFTYDTTLTQLQLQRKDLSIQQMKINLNTAKEELKAIKKYKPIYYHPTKPTPPPTTKPSTDTIPDLGDLTDVNYRIYSGTGNSRTAPKYCWLRSGALVDESVMEDLFSGVKADEVYVVFQNTRNNSAAGKITNEYGLLITRVAQEVPTEPTVPPTEPPTAPTDPPTEPPTDPTTEPSTDPSTEPPTDPSIDPTAETEPQDPHLLKLRRRSPPLWCWRRSPGSCPMLTRSAFLILPLLTRWSNPRLPQGTM